MSDLLYDAAVNGDFNLVKQIVKGHPDSIDQGDEDGFTPLHGVAEEGHLEMAQYLIDHGANVNALSNDGKTALDLAVEAQNEEMTALLTTHGAKKG